MPASASHGDLKKGPFCKATDEPFGPRAGGLVRAVPATIQMVTMDAAVAVAVDADGDDVETADCDD